MSQPDLTTRIDALLEQWHQGQLLSLPELVEALREARTALAAEYERGRVEEREACAVIIEEEGRKSRYYPGETIAETYCDDAASLIRARGETND